MTTDIGVARDAGWQEQHRLLQEAVERHMIRYVGDFPDFFIERADGAYIYDDRGRRILDFTSGQMCATLGHNHPDVVAAIEASCGRAIHLFSWLLAPEVVELCRELAALLPPQLQKVMLLNTGSEANEVALRMAKLATGRHEVVGLSGSFHGLTGGAGAVTYSVGRNGYGPGDPGQPGDPGAERLSLPDPPLRRHLRHELPRGRLRAGRQPEHGRARGGDRRADHEHRRRHRAARGLFPAHERAVRGAWHAADPGRGADRLRPGRRQFLLRAGRAWCRIF